MRPRDFAILVLSAIGVLVTFMSETSISIHKGFFVPFPDVLPDTAVIPAPHVLDLNGDGVKEIALLRSPDTLVILDPRKVKGQQEFYQLPYIHVAYLPSACIGLGHGFTKRIDPEAPPSGPRKQIVVTITNNFVVTAFNDRLEQLWVRYLHPRTSADQDAYAYGDSVVKTSFVPTVATVIVLPHAAWEGDEGMVVVAVDTYAPAKTTPLRPNGAPLPPGSMDDSVNTMGHADGGVADTLQRGDSVHMSYYCFHAADGATRWVHDAFSSMNDVPDALRTYAAGSYKLRASHIEHHRGEQDWRVYARGFMKVLRAHPHAHSHPAHAAMVPAFFSRKQASGPRNRTAAAAKRASMMKSFGIGSNLVNGMVADAIASSHDETDHILHPNVVVVHRRGGVEAIHLFSGRTVAQIAPLHPHVLYTDLNADGEIDNAVVHTEQARRSGLTAGFEVPRGPTCRAVVTSGLTPRFPDARAKYGDAPTRIEAAASLRAKAGGARSGSDHVLWHGKVCSANSDITAGFELFDGALRNVATADETNDSDDLGDVAASGLAPTTPALIYLSATSAARTAGWGSAGGAATGGAGGKRKSEPAVVFALSNGVVTAVAPRRGSRQVLWQAATASTFPPTAVRPHQEKYASVALDKREASARTTIYGSGDETHAAFPHVVPYEAAALHSHGRHVAGHGVAAAKEHSHVVAVGARVITVLRASDGTIEATARLPAAVTAPLVIDDFNSDGVNDIIWTSRHGIGGLVVRKTAGAGAGSLIIRLAVGVLLVLLVAQALVSRSADPFGRSKRSAFKHKRATD